jgi:hypothetical protein
VLIVPAARTIGVVWSSGTMIGSEHTNMKMRHFLARSAAMVTAASAIGMFLGPASVEAADHQVHGSVDRNHDNGSNDMGSAMIQASGFGSLLDGWANRDLDIGAFAFGSDMTAASGFGSLLDGWANRDLDIVAFGSDMADGIGTQAINVSAWRALGTRSGGEVISDF